MDKLDETLLNGIDRYFNYLSNFGKSTKDQKNALLIFLHIKQMLESSMNLYGKEHYYYYYYYYYYLDQADTLGFSNLYYENLY